jgi:hypothetical protein
MYLSVGYQFEKTKKIYRNLSNNDLTMITERDAIHIAEGLIADNFPELKAKRIKFSFVSGKEYDFYMAVKYVLFDPRIIIEREILTFSKSAFSGCLGHELAHIVIDSKKSIFRRLLNVFIGDSDSSTEERLADLLSIERGLGDALIQFHTEHEKDYKRYKPSEGLTKREIKKILSAH